MYVTMRLTENFSDALFYTTHVGKKSTEQLCPGKLKHHSC